MYIYTYMYICIHIYIYIFISIYTFISPWYLGFCSRSVAERESLGMLAGRHACWKCQWGSKCKGVTGVAGMRHVSTEVHMSQSCHRYQPRLTCEPCLQWQCALRCAAGMSLLRCIYVSYVMGMSHVSHCESCLTSKRALRCGGVSHVAHAWLVPVRRVSPVNHVSHVHYVWHTSLVPISRVVLVSHVFCMSQVWNVSHVWHVSLQGTRL